MLSPHKTGKVLIVEDEFLVALQIEDMMLDCGHSVVGMIADLGSLEGIDIAPDVALVDLNLRDGLTGPEIARIVSEKFGSRIVYVTANPNELELPAPTALGIVQKPFSREAIIAAIDYALNDNAGGPPPSDLEPLTGTR